MLYLLFHPHSNYLVPSRSRVDTEGKRCVALTFDDGPNSQHTLQIISLLREKKITATFFLVGCQVSKHPDLARLLLSEGNQVGNHTYSHPPLFCFLSPRRLREEVEKCQVEIKKACGFTPRHFRSPVGLRHPLLRNCLLQTGLEFISWRARAFDTWEQDPETLTRKILEDIAPGDIILLHDKPGNATMQMLNALPGMIDELKRRGFEFVPV
jgi:peptidoglycan/xylan/chitin deacetylase (PgdA/CDA1 family)